MSILSYDHSEMRKFQHTPDDTLPDTRSVTLPSVSGKQRKHTELAVFDEHRLAFYYWFMWTRRKMRGHIIEAPPLLVTIDWHRDLAPPDNYKNRLDKLSVEEPDEVLHFARKELADYNDEQIPAACWLNLIGDVILLKNYGMNQSETFADREGNVHRILEFRDFESFRPAVCSRDDRAVYLDIDLDYFIHNKVAPHQKEEVDIYSDEEIKAAVDPDDKLFQNLFDRLEGITVAKEPRYCGGKQNSEHIWEVVRRQLFGSDFPN